MTMLALFLLILPILLFFLGHKKQNNTIPGPIGLPFLGNMLQIDNSAPHIYLGKLALKYGQIMSIRLGSIPILVISSVKLAKEVMKTNDPIFCSRPLLLGQQKLSYNGFDVAFSPYNDYWREIRKVCVLHLFSIKKVQSFRPIREDEVSHMINKISEISYDSKVVNLNEILTSMTSSLTCRVAFGKKYEDEGHLRSRFHGLCNEIQAAIGSFLFSDYLPFLSWIDKINGSLARIDKIFEDMDSFYQELIDDHLSITRPESMKDDFLDILLTLKKDRLAPMDLTYEHIKGVLMNVILGGTDTGAVTVIWAMTALMKNPKSMNKVQDEIRKHISKNEKNIIDEDDIKNLPYLSAVIKEAMRLYPPVPLLVPRETMEKCILNGYEIPSKTTVYVNAWAIGRDPEAWENPEDFSPERFLNSDIDFRGHDFELIPFGAGRRGCPGLNMGIATVELALANLLYSFNWEMPNGTTSKDIDMDTKPGLAMHKKNDLCLVATKYYP